MSSFTRGVASAAVAAIASQFASAGFVYESANRTVSTSVIGQGADSDSSAVFGAWFGSASTVGSGYTVLSTQGSELAYSQMTFVGAAQISGSSASTDISAASWADLSFLADSTESIAWILGLGESAVGASTSSAVSVQVTDLTTSLTRLFASGDFTGSGSFGVIAGHRYRVVVNATSASASAGEVLHRAFTGWRRAVGSCSARWTNTPTLNRHSPRTISPIHESTRQRRLTERAVLSLEERWLKARSS